MDGVVMYPVSREKKQTRKWLEGKTREEARGRVYSPHTHFLRPPFKNEKVKTNGPTKPGICKVRQTYKHSP